MSSNLLQTQSDLASAIDYIDRAFRLARSSAMRGIGSRDPKDVGSLMDIRDDLRAAKTFADSALAGIGVSLQSSLAKSAAYVSEYRAPSPRGGRPVSPRGDLWNMTVYELQNLARQRGLTGYSSATKAQLIALLEEHGL